MKQVELKAELSGTTYPGRGIIVGKSEDGKKAVAAYWTMGRSAGSRNRIFELYLYIIFITKIEEGFFLISKD